MVCFPLHLKVFGESPIIQVRPCFRVTCQGFLVHELGPGAPPVAREKMVMMSVAGWQKDLTTAMLRVMFEETE